MVKLKFLRWKDEPGVSRWAQCNHKGHYKREASELKGDVRTKQRLERRDDAMLLAVKVEGRAWSRGL